MIALRLLEGFFLTVLLTGCYINPFGESGKNLVDDVSALRAKLVGNLPHTCLPPGAMQTSKCFFVLTITDPNAGGGFVTGHVAVKACEQNHNSGNQYEDCTKVQYPDYNFKVDGSPTLVAGSDYQFDSGPNSNILVCRGKCDPVTSPLPEEN